MSDTVSTARRIISGTLALVITTVCIAMAATAASERATTGSNQTMMIAVAMALVLGAHMLPALARRNGWAMLLFAGCVLATIYNHAHFFAAAQYRAGSERAQAVVTTGHAQALQAELEAASAARPLPIVSAELAKATTRAEAAKVALARMLPRCESATDGRCSTAKTATISATARLNALQDEYAQARRAAEIRTQLAAAAATHDAVRAAHSADPVDVQIATMTGLPVTAVGLASAVTQSLLLELLAALLWMLAMPGPVAAVITGKFIPPSAPTPNAATT